MALPEDMDGILQTTQRWQYWLLTGVLVIAFFWFSTSAAIKCRCHESDSHHAQAQAGMIFVGIVLLRVVAAALFRDRRFHWHVYLVMTLLSPFWIWLVFKSVLIFRDAYLA